MDHQQARESLEAITSARRRSGALRQYRDAWSIVAAWGIVWLVGYSAQQFFPAFAPWVWGLGWVGALGFTMTRPRKPRDSRALATWGVAVAFVLLLLIAIRADMRTAAMVFALVLAASYAVLGIWAGGRFMALGAVVLAAACLGWWLVPDWLFVALAVGGGGALIVGAAWLRRP